MARMALTTGSCPSCGRDVVRTVSLVAGISTEVYHCPLHGRRQPVPDMTVAAFASPTMADLREMYALLAPHPGPLAGLDWVA
jgi:hypothetical protein